MLPFPHIRRRLAPAGPIRAGIVTACVLGSLLACVLPWASSSAALAQESAREAAGEARADALPSVDRVRGVRAARVAHLEGDHARELETLRQLVELEPDALEALYALVLFHEDHPGASAEERDALRAELTAALTRAGRRAPLDVLALLADQHDDPEALAAVADELERRVAGPASQDPETLETLFLLRVRQEDVLAATETLETLYAVQPTTTNRRRLLQLYRFGERWRDAADLVAAWLEEEPSPDLRLTHLELLSRLGEIEAVEQEVQRLLDDTSNLALQARRLYLDRVLTAAWNLRDAGKDEAAERLFRRVAELDPESEEASAALLHLYGSEEDRARLARQEAERWQGEDDPQALFDEGTERLTAGDAAGALPLLQRAAPQMAHLEPAWYNLGMAAYRLEEWEVVAEAFARAAELNDARPQTFLYRGLALEKVGRCDEAVVALERALELDPALTNAHYYLASCYARLGRMEDAARHRQLYEDAS